VGQGELFNLTTERRKPGPIRVGTSGYSFADWVGPFYPPKTRSGAMLSYYQRFFSVVEINATYYRIPPPSTMKGMVERTPSDFQFMVKLPGSLTHERDRNPEPAEAFLRAIEPMRSANKFTGALAQFPFSFKFSEEAQTYLQWMRGNLAEIPLFVEYRHSSWDNPVLKPVLDELGAGFCSVDEPALPGLFPPKSLLVGDVAYVRFHGRNENDWWSGGPKRYDYLYKESELAQWSNFIKDLADRAKQTYVFFNNCHAGKAVLNARTMEELLGLEPD